MRPSRGEQAARRAGRASALAACAIGLLISCAAQPDHFYALSTLPDTPRPAAAGFKTHVILGISLPAWVDRRQLTLEAPGDRILILEHERWAAPLEDLMTQTLARDIERRRPDVLVADRSFDQPGVQPVRVKIDVVRMSAHKSGRATLEARWRIIDPAAQADSIERGTFSSPIEGEDYAAVTKAFSACIAALADRLVVQLPLR